MAKQPDTPCVRCRKLLWSGPRSKPASQRLCAGCRKKGLPAAPEPAVAAEDRGAPADHFGPRGARLWNDMAAAAAKMTPVELVLLEEACRAADRLDKLDDFLAGHGEVWLRFRRNDDGTVIRVTVDRALAEVRQQADSLRGIVADLLRKSGAAPAPEKSEGSRRDELAKRRDERRRSADM